MDNIVTLSDDNSIALNSDHIAGPTINKWMNTATKAQKMSYLSRGEPQVIKLTKRNAETCDFYISYYPAIRGILFSQECKTAEEALKIAIKMKKDILKKEKLEEINEVDLEITGEAQSLYLSAKKERLNIESIIHIGTMLHNLSVMKDREELIEELDIENLREQIPEIKKAIPDEESGKDLSSEELFEIMTEAGLYGFIINASIPLFESTSEYSSKFMGVSRMRCFYGETYEKVMQRAIAWAKKENENMRTKEAA